MEKEIVWDFVKKLKREEGKTKNEKIEGSK